MINNAVISADTYQKLETEITQLAVQLYATTYRLLLLIREFDEQEIWAVHGIKSCAHWLHWRIGLNLGAAHEKVRVAHALKKLPEVSAAFAQGQLSYAKVRALTRVSEPNTEKHWLAIALAGTAAHIENLASRHRKVQKQMDPEAQARKHYLQTYFDEDGMLVIHGRLKPADGAALCKALDTIQKQNFDAADTSRPSWGQQRANALAELAEHELRDSHAKNAANPAQVIIHVDEQTLRKEKTSAEISKQPAVAIESPETPLIPTQESPLCYLENGPSFSAENARLLACDAEIQQIRHGKDGIPIHISRKSRLVSGHLRRALKERDQGCRFPGCTHKAYVDAHHIEHWADGGPTQLDNLVLLCRRHHHLIHEQGFWLQTTADGELLFYRPDGSLLPQTPALPHLNQTWHPPSPATTLPCWNGDKMNYSFALSGLLPMNR